MKPIDSGNSIIDGEGDSIVREFDDYGIKICRYQGEVFSMSREMTACSSPIFLRRFMHSAVAQRMDGEGFLYEEVTQADVIEEIDREYGKSDYGREKFSGEELYWVGYLYRYWCYTHQISSKSLYRLIKPAELKKLYAPYQPFISLKEIERIIEESGLEEEEHIQRGVEILRKMLEKEAH